MNETTPKISVIVPVYKAENYLHRCVDSLLAQTFQDFEILLVDDGSPDCSGEICDEYARKDKRVRVFHTPNQGVVAARAYGAKFSTGEWLTFVDSDDTLPNYCIEKGLQAKAGKDTNIIVGYYHQPPIKKVMVLSAVEYRKESIVGSPRVMLGMCAKFYHRSLLTSDDILMLPRDIIQGEDMLVNIKLSFSNQKDVVFLPLIIYNYNTNNQQSCMHTFKPTIEYIDRFHKLLYQCIPFSERGFYKNELLQAKIVSLRFIIHMTGNISWKRSHYYRTLNTELHSGFNMMWRDRLLLSFPRLYRFIYRLYKTIIR